MSNKSRLKRLEDRAPNQQPIRLTRFERYYAEERGDDRQS